MNSGGRSLLKILGVLALVGVALLGVAFFGLATVCGGLRDKGALPYMLLALVVAMAATAGAVVLTRSLISAKAASAAERPVAAAPNAVRDLAAEASALLYLRIAVVLRFGLSALLFALPYAGVTATGAPRLLAPALVSIAIYLLPFAWVLWALRERLERFAVWLALAFASVGGLWSLWNLARMWQYLAQVQVSYAARTGLSVALDFAIAFSAWRARRALPAEPDADRGVIAFLVAVVYLAVASALTQLVYRLLTA